MPEFPGTTMRRAAVAMRSSVNDLREDLADNDYWACDHPQATEDEIYAAGTEDGLGGEAGAFAASWTPGVALAVADWLDATADDIDTATLDYGGKLPDSFRDATWDAALKTARAYLNETTREGER